jgi:hypothetical protein
MRLFRGLGTCDYGSYRRLGGQPRNCEFEQSVAVGGRELDQSLDLIQVFFREDFGTKAVGSSGALG